MPFDSDSNDEIKLRFALGENKCDGLGCVVRLLPRDAGTRQSLRSHAGARRWAWNKALEIWNAMEAAARLLPVGSPERMAAWPNTLNVRSALSKLVSEDPLLEWARHVDSRVFQEAVADLAKAKAKNAAERKRVALERAVGRKAKFSKLCGEPRVKRKGKDADRFRTTNDRIRFRRHGARHQVHLTNIGWVDLAEEVPRLGKLMSATIHRHGDDFFAAFAFQREGVQTKRDMRKDVVRELKHPRKPGAESRLRLPCEASPHRRVLTDVAPLAALIDGAKLDDVVGGDRGERTAITLSRPVRIVRGASDRQVFKDAATLTALPISPADKPASGQASPRRRLGRQRSRGCVAGSQPSHRAL